MDYQYVGETAALGTAVCWAITALAFESAGRRVGSLPVNLIRLVMGLGFLIPTVWWRRGLPLPTDASAETWFWLGISGLVGFAFGDLCLFRAFVLIGSRLSMLLMSLVPPFTAVISWLVLRESLAPVEWLGMTLTVSGVAWVILERTPDPAGARRRPAAWGLTLGLLGALGQAAGLVLSKYGMQDYDPFAANLIRVLAGIVGFSVIFTFSGGWTRFGEAIRNARAMRRTLVGGFFGPFLGVSLSLMAVQHAPAGVAASIIAVSPVLILPASVWLLKEHVSLRAVAGALLAVAGTVVLFS